MPVHVFLPRRSEGHAVPVCLLKYFSAPVSGCKTLSHADLTEDYAQIPAEMKKVAAFFKQDVLREVDEKEFYSQIPGLRSILGDRPVLRALHLCGNLCVILCKVCMRSFCIHNTQTVFISFKVSRNLLYHRFFRIFKINMD